ncbi:MAG: DNA replication/repair protein RecF [Zetaproteobacteria bacterium]|nr:MAG: DNA replication/repair protein RecF [Zetaproteobacteria bacterium]
MKGTPVLLQKVCVQNLRCHEHLTWRCTPGINLLVGENGSGKTTVLESVYMMAWGRSFRQARDPYLVRHQAERFRIVGQWYRFGPMTLEISGRKGCFVMRLQGREVARRKETAMAFPVIVDAPQGPRLVDGLPGERRRWLSALMSLKWPISAQVHQRYLRAIMQRARLLRRKGIDAQLDVWEEQIVALGMDLDAWRSSLIEEMNKLLSRESLPEGFVQIRSSGGGYQRESWVRRLRDKRQDDARTGLRFGPHADRLIFELDGRELRQAGSRGQQKLAGIAIRMAECELWRRYRGLIPVLLLDDAWEALDRGRRRRLMDRLSSYEGQVLMTTPNMPGVAGDEVKIQNIEELCEQVDSFEHMGEAA